MTSLPNRSSNYTEIFNTSMRCGGKFTTTSQQRSLMLILFCICSVGAFCSFINLLVFRKWKNKQPFLYFHVSLSLAEGLYLLMLTPSLLARVIGTSPSHLWPYIIGVVASYYGAMLYNIHIFCISMDRWISVDFSVFYRNRIGRLVILGVVSGMWIYCTVFAAVLFSVLGQYIVVSCTSVAVFTYPKIWFAVYVEGSLVFTTGVVAVTQSRLIFVAIRAKLRVLRTRKINSASLSYGETGGSVNNSGRRNIISESKRTKELLAVMTKTVLTGSIVVILAVVCQIPMAILRWTNQSQSSLYALFVLLFHGEHILPLFVYIIFYPQYRLAVRSLIKQSVDF